MSLAVPGSGSCGEKRAPDEEENGVGTLIVAININYLQLLWLLVFSGKVQFSCTVQFSLLMHQQP